MAHRQGTARRWASRPGRARELWGAPYSREGGRTPHLRRVTLPAGPPARVRWYGLRSTIPTPGQVHSTHLFHLKSRPRAPRDARPPKAEGGNPLIVVSQAWPSTGDPEAPMGQSRDGTHTVPPSTAARAATSPPPVPLCVSPACLVARRSRLRHGALTKVLRRPVGQRGVK